MLTSPTARQWPNESPLETFFSPYNMIISLSAYNQPFIFQDTRVFFLPLKIRKQENIFLILSQCEIKVTAAPSEMIYQFWGNPVISRHEKDSCIWRLYCNKIYDFEVFVLVLCYKMPISDPITPDVLFTSCFILVFNSPHVFSVDLLTTLLIQSPIVLAFSTLEVFMSLNHCVTSL